MTTSHRRGSARACVYAESPAIGLLPAVGRQRGNWDTYVLGLYNFTDLSFEDAIDEWHNVRRDERQQFRRVVRHLLACSMIKADRVVCVSAGLEQQVQTRFADYPLPPIATIPNALPTRARAGHRDPPRHRGWVGLEKRVVS